MRAKNTNSRLTFDKDFYYSNKVCIGNWVISRQNEQAPIQYEVTYKTVTSEDYGPKPRKSVDPAICSDRRIASENSNIISPAISTNTVPTFFENYSTTYDLAFNHFPKSYKYCIPKTNYDYTSSYGNLTNYGLISYKRNEWDCEVEDPSRNLVTHYREQFDAPTENDYKFKRFGIPRPNSTKLPGSNMLNAVVKLRNWPVCVSPDINLVTPPRCYQPAPWDL